MCVFKNFYGTTTIYSQCNITSAFMMIGSTQKRKRDVFDANIAGGVSKARLRPHGKIDFDLDYSMFQGKVFDSGDILLLASKTECTILKDGIFCASPVTCTFDLLSCRFVDPQREIDSYEDVRGNHHYFGCTKDAESIFALSGDDKRISVVSLKLALDNADEIITSVCCAGFHTIYISHCVTYICFRSSWNRRILHKRTLCHWSFNASCIKYRE